MRWRFWRHRHDSGRADDALAEAEEQNQRVRRQWPEVNEVARTHRALREHNHFADAIRRALEGR